ncbi:MAG: hypothetical protein ACNS63_04050 [Candidatus Nitrospinota bacterium M3_3B_026]
MSVYAENINKTEIPASVILAMLSTPVVAAIAGLAMVSVLAG